MKKLFFVLMLCPLLMLTMPSCSGGTGSTNSGTDKTKMELLDKEIDLSNHQMPMQVDFATTLMSLKRQSMTVSYQYVVDEDAIDMDEVIANQRPFKTTLENQITTVKEAKYFASMVADAGCDLHFVYDGNHSAKNVTIEFTNAELKSILKK